MMQSRLLFTAGIQGDMQSVSTSSITMSMHSNSRFLPTGFSYQNQVPERDSSTVAEFAKDAVIILLLGTVGLICLMVVTYLLTILMDRLSPYYMPHDESPEGDSSSTNALNGISPLTAARAVEAANRDIGTLTRKAHLWGIHVDEREKVLRAFFQERTSIFGQKEEPARHDALGDIEMGDTTEKPADVPTETPVIDTGSNAETNDTIQEQVPNDFSHDATDMQGMCCICLLPYEQGESVMTGTQCRHLYHFDCCQAWLAQHDHCPYCRQEMIRPAEFRHAALDVLGEPRVNQLLMQHNHLTAAVTIPPTMVFPPTTEPTVTP